MKNIVKKVAIFSMVGMMQVGLGTSAIEASPLHNDPAPMQQQYDRDQGRHEEDRFEHERHERHERERVENERYENEMQQMKRHFFESASHWHDRQHQATERHERALEEIRHEHHR